MKNRKELLNDGLTADWLRDNGITVRVFSTADDKLLKAQKTAHTLLTQHTNLLTADQIQTLRTFTKRMAHKNTRTKLTPKSAYPILNISTKINRQIFQQYRQLNKTGTE
jgi:adenine-specific DNA methylase